MKKIFSLVVIALISLTSVAQNKASLTKFWKTFQPLLVANNYTALSKYVKFPLSAQGTLDDVKVLKISKAKFANAMKNFMALEVYPTSSADNSAVTNQIYYTGLTSLTNEREVSLHGKNARIGDLEFTFTGGKWLLTSYYDGRTE
jgi:hypothetical protein